MITEDECIFKLDPTIGRSWFEKGSKPFCMVNGSKEKIFLFGALDQSGNLHHKFYEKQDSDSFIDFLKLLLEIYDKIILVSDRAPWHRSKKTKLFIKDNKERISIIHLPKYSPETNPVEECWRQIRANVTKNTFFESKEEMQTRISEFINGNKFNLNLLNYLCL